MKEIEAETTVITIEMQPSDEPEGQVTTVEIVDMRLDVVMARRAEHIMSRTLRIRTALTKDDHTHSNSHRITF